MMQANGWRVHRTPLIWHKPTAHRVPWPNCGPRRQYEIILYAVKGDRPVAYIGSDVITCALDENLGHSAQKPVGLLTELLKRSGIAGAKVLDPFCGTGSTIVAAHGLKMSCTGMEMSDASYGIAANRLKGLK
jgi:site-specific DNA-methyltransferase (adenine-specific)